MPLLVQSRQIGSSTIDGPVAWDYKQPCWIAAESVDNEGVVVSLCRDKVDMLHPLRSMGVAVKAVKRCAPGVLFSA